MKIKNWVLFVAMQLASLFSVPLLAQTDTDFWFAAPAISTSNNNLFRTPISLNITSYNSAAIVTINQPSGNMTTQIISIPPNSTFILNISNQLDTIECTPANTKLNTGIKISSTTPVSVYYENSSFGSPELFVLKGKNSLGTDFWISSQYLYDNSTFFSPAFSSFVVLSSEDNTVINITPSKDIIGNLANIPFAFVLNKGQCYVAQAANNLAGGHLQGSHITSDKPIAITLCDDLINFGACSDLVGDQTIPISKIGTEYIAVKGLLEAPFDRLFLTATKNGTNINKDGSFLVSLNEGQSYETTVSNRNAYIQSNLPIYAYQLSGIGCETGSAILPQINCTGSSKISFVRSSTLDLFITLLVRSGGESNFLVNGAPGVINISDFNAVAGTSNQWVTALILLDSINFPKGSIVSVTNTSSLFHLGVLQGSFQHGASFGYFSDFNIFQANATANNKNLCIGAQLELFADTINSATYKWTGPNGFNSNEQNPVLLNINKLNAGEYVLEVSIKNCGVSYDTVNIGVDHYDAGLILCYPFDGNVLDFSGNENHGTIFGRISSTQDRFGISGKAFNFDSGFILLNRQVSSSIKSPSTAITICAWMKLYSIDSIAPLVCKSNTTGNVPPQYKLGIKNTREVLFGYNENGSFPETEIESGTNIFPLGTWFHLAVTYDGNYVKYYKDGILFDSIAESGLIINTKNEPLEIGRDAPDPIDYLDGDLDDLKIYNRPLSSDEIFNIYVDTISCSCTCSSILYTENKNICKGQSYFQHTITGVYIDTFRSQDGCDSIRTLNLTVTPLQNIQIIQTICTGETFEGYDTTGIYVDTFQLPSRCDSIRTLTLTIIPPTINSSVEICEGNSYSIGRNIYRKAGRYLDTIWNGCSTIIITNLSVNTNFLAESDILLCNGDKYVIGSNTYTKEGRYMDHYKNVKNCDSIIVTILRVEECNHIFAPSVFSPNADNVNDLFYPIGKDIDNFEIKIFDRWGNHVFQSNQFIKAWDGKFNGEDMMPGVYVYIIQGNYIGGIPFILSGDLTLIR